MRSPTSESGTGSLDQWEATSGGSELPRNWSFSLSTSFTSVPRVSALRRVPYTGTQARDERLDVGRTSANSRTKSRKVLALNTRRFQEISATTGKCTRVVLQPLSEPAIREHCAAEHEEGVN